MAGRNEPRCFQTPFSRSVPSPFPANPRGGGGAKPNSTSAKPQGINRWARPPGQVTGQKPLPRQQIHTGERPYHCQQCDKAFRKSWDLKRHQVVHSGAKPYHCHQCDKEYRTLQHLKRHQVVHNVERPYRCQQCDKDYKTSDHLRRHQLVHNGGSPVAVRRARRGNLHASLKRLYKREVGHRLRAAALSDYLRGGLIPEGLRIEKAPPSGMEIGGGWRADEVFCDRWCQITDKCSSDLMALCVQESSERAEKTREKIEGARARLRYAFGEDVEALAEVEDELYRHRLEVERKATAEHRKAFDRDSERYKSGVVYEWRGVL